MVINAAGVGLPAAADLKLVGAPVAASTVIVSDQSRSAAEADAQAVRWVVSALWQAEGPGAALMALQVDIRCVYLWALITVVSTVL